MAPIRDRSANPCAADRGRARETQAGQRGDDEENRPDDIEIGQHRLPQRERRE